MSEDAVNHPKHYLSHPSGVECIEIVRDMSFNCGNAVKYLFRSEHKGKAMQDTQKAAWYIRDEIRRALSGRVQTRDHEVEQWASYKAFIEHEPRVHVRVAVQRIWEAQYEHTDTVEALEAALAAVEEEERRLIAS